MTEPLSVLAAAIAPGSSREQRAAAADVCRMLIAALEAQEGQPLPAPTVEAQPGEPLPIVASSAPAASSAPVASADPAAHRAPVVPDEPAAPSAPVAPDAHQVAADAPHAEPLEPESRNRRTAPMRAAVPLRPPALPIDPQAVASLIEAARTLPTETMLDLAISHVRSMVQAKGQPVPSPSAPVRFQLVPLPPGIKRQS